MHGQLELFKKTAHTQQQKPAFSEVFLFYTPINNITQPCGAISVSINILLLQKLETITRSEKY